ncbi:Rossmann-like and DUF2520 domain-containing protein [Bacteroidota bacterium]
MKPIQKISIIGAGCVANFFAKELYGLGYEILEIISRTEERAGELAKSCHAKLNIDGFDHMDQSADLYILSVKDDAIMELRKKIKLKDQLIVHTSGTVSSEVLKKTSSNFGILYPLQSFSKDYTVSFADVPLFVSANQPDDEERLFSFARKLNPNVMRISDEKRAVLHLAAVFASNFPNYLLKLSKEILEDDDIDFKLLQPLVRVSMEKAFISGPEKSQTGPARRGDCSITDKHQLMLKNESWKKLYALMSEMIRKDFKGK